MSFIPFMVAFIVGAIYGRVFTDMTPIFHRIAPSVVPYMGFVDGIRAGYILLLTYGVVAGFEWFFILLAIGGLYVILQYVPLVDKSTTERELTLQCQQQIRATGVYLFLAIVALVVMI